MNSTLSAQTDTILIMFGDLMQAACMGDRRMVSIQISDQRYFDSDQIALRATERFDIVVANLGATTDGTWRTPMVALKTASS
jgi:HK97 family phage major capsid protein